MENWATCFQMYRSNTSLRHIPMIIIVSVDIHASYIYIAAPEQRECDPIYMGPKPYRPLPSIWTAALNFFRIAADFIVNLFYLLSMKVLTRRFACGSVPLYDWTCVTGLLTVGLGRNAGDLICTCRQINSDHRFYGIQN